MKMEVRVAVVRYRTLKFDIINIYASEISHILVCEPGLIRQVSKLFQSARAVRHICLVEFDVGRDSSLDIFHFNDAIARVVRRYPPLYYVHPAEAELKTDISST